MSLTLSSATLAVLDESFSIPSKTSDLNNPDVKVDFEGRNAVTIRNWATVAENDYVRTGVNRFGVLNELGGGTQTLTLSQDKGATWSIDTGTLKDTDNTAVASTTIDRQLRLVAVPNVDIYNLAILQAYAVANSQTATSSIGTTDAFSKFLVQTAALTDALVPDDNREVYTTETIYNDLRLDANFTKACNDAYADLKTGVRTMINGVKVHVVPTSYLVTNTGYLFVHGLACKPVPKMSMSRVLTEQRGIDGSICEYRRYHDFFILAKKGVSIRAHMLA